MPSAHPPLLLASPSPARSTWWAARVEALVRVSSVDEDSVVTAAEARHEALGAADVALLLARAKAEDVVAALEAEEGDPDGSLELDVDVIVLGYYSVLELDGEVHGKPVDAAEATAVAQDARPHRRAAHRGTGS